MRVVVGAVVLAIAVAAPAAAQQPQNSNAPVATSSNGTSVFSKASIDRAVASTVNAAPNATKSATPAAAKRLQKKSFWKTPWPYVIAGAAAAGIWAAVYYSGDGTNGGPY
jgi:hypothetical protein